MSLSVCVNSVGLVTRPRRIDTPDRDRSVRGEVVHGWYRRVVNGRYIRWVVTHTRERTNERARVGRRPDRRSERRVDLTMDEWMNGWNGLVPRRARNTATGTGTTALRSAFFLCIVDSTRLDSSRLASPVSVGRGRTNRTEPNREVVERARVRNRTEPNDRAVRRTNASATTNRGRRG